MKTDSLKGGKGLPDLRDLREKCNITQDLSEDITIQVGDQRSEGIDLGELNQRITVHFSSREVAASNCKFSEVTEFVEIPLGEREDTKKELSTIEEALKFKNLRKFSRGFLNRFKGCLVNIKYKLCYKREADREVEEVIKSIEVTNCEIDREFCGDL